MPTDWETRYYEQQALHTEARGMLCQERDRYKAENAKLREACIGFASRVSFLDCELAAARAELINLRMAEGEHSNG
jgi:hypothetical protein